MAARHLAEKTRRRLAKEVGTVHKPHGGRLRVALVFPNTYYVGMSNLGAQAVYRLLNDRDEVVCERVFLPDPPDLEELTRSRHALFTMESQTPVRDFDVLAFSLPYELDYPNVLKILALSGLNEIAADRDGDAPLVIAGGPAAIFNPEPLAPFIDLFVIGEAEAVLPEMLDVLRRAAGLTRTELLLRLAEVQGVYVPRFYEPEYNEDGTVRRVRVARGVPEVVRRRWVESLDDHAATSAILTPETEFSNMVLAEVARGCGWRCRFCVVGSAFLPPRARAPAVVLEGIRAMDQRTTGCLAERPRVGLISSSVFDHPGSLTICRSLAEDGRLFSISSTRVDTLSRDIVEVLRRGGHELLTMAPEAGSDRLRRAIKKSMSDEEILGAAAAAWGGGFGRIKLYFMVGLPTETSEDVVGIAELVSEIAGRFRWERVIVSISCFVPKPWTPFQWAPMEEQKVLAEKISRLRQALSCVKCVAAAAESPRESVVQGVLARGDRRLRDALLSRSRERTSWRAAFRQADVDPRFYAQRSRREDEIFPWDHLDLGVEKGHLWREYTRALNGFPGPA